MNPKILMIAGGVIGAGVLAYLYGSYEKKRKEKYAEFDKKIKELHSLRLPNGKINVEAVMKLMTYTKEYAEKGFKEAVKSLARERRKILNDNDFTEYLEVCQECLELQREVEEEYMTRALDKLGMEKEEFEEEAAQLPQEAMESMMARQGQPKLDEDISLPPNLNKARTKAIFKEINSIEDKNNEKYRELFEEIENVVKGMDQMSGMAVRMGISQFVESDILYNEHHITTEQLTKAMQVYQIVKDPEILGLIQEKYKKMGVQMQ